MTSKRVGFAALAAIVASLPARAAVTISTAATQNMTCSSGVCAPTAADAVLNVTDLEALLASGNVSIVTTNGGVEANDIVLAAKLVWSRTALTLNASESIFINSTASVRRKGGLNVIDSTGGNGGIFSFGKGGNISFDSLASALAIDGKSYKLVNSVQSLASAIESNPGGNFAFTKNYDASGDGTYFAPPVQKTIMGSFDGLGHEITNLSMNIHTRCSAAGLFVEIGATATVQHFGLRNERVNVGLHCSSSAGGLTGDNDGVLFQDFVGGQIKANAPIGAVIGGLAGGNIGTIDDCSTDSTVKVASEGSGAGGLVGANGGTIIDSRAAGKVTGFAAGGLVAENESVISTSYSSSNVMGQSTELYSDYAGGLVGINDGSIANSYSIGKTSGYSISNVGGFAGVQEAGTITDSYSTGTVASGGGYTGGFDGVNEAAIANSYWDTDTSGTDQGSGNGNDAGLTGLTTEQFQSGLPTGFDPSIWAEDSNINNGFPYLIANPPPK